MPIIPGTGNASASLTVAGVTRATYSPSAPPPPPPTSGFWGGDPALQQLTVDPGFELLSEQNRFGPMPLISIGSVSGGGWQTPADRTAYDRTWGGLHHIIETGRSTLGRNTQLLHPSHRNRTFRIGRESMEVLEPGLYTIRRGAYAPGGLWGVSEPFTLTVQHPNDAILAANTVVLSNFPGETWAAAPPHDAVNRCTTLAQAKVQWATMSSRTTPVRLSVRNDTTYDEILTERFFLPNGGFAGRWLIDTWDYDGLPATFDPGHRLDYRGGQPGTVHNIRIVLDNIPQTESVKTGRGARIETRLWSRPNSPLFADRAFQVFSRCDIIDSEFMIDADAAGENISFFFDDCLLKNLGDYIIFNGRDFAFLNSLLDVDFGIGLGYVARHHMGPIVGFEPVSDDRGINQYYGKGHNGVRGLTRLAHVDGSLIQGIGGWSGDTRNQGDFRISNQAFFRVDGNASTASSLSAPLRSESYVVTRSVWIATNNPTAGGEKWIWEANAIVTPPSAGGGGDAGAVTLGRGGTNNRSPMSPGLVLRNNVLMHVGNPRGSGWRTGKNFTIFGPNVTESSSGTSEFGQTEGFFDLERNTNGTLDERVTEIMHNWYSIYRNAQGRPTTPVVYRDLAGTPIVDLHNVLYAPEHGIAPQCTFEPLGFNILDVWFGITVNVVYFTLQADVPDQGWTPVYPYPLDFNGVQETLADYAGSFNRHVVQFYPARSLKQFAYQNNPPNCTVELLVNGVRAQNLTGATWASGTSGRIYMDRGTTAKIDNLVWTIPADRKRLPRLVNPTELPGDAPSTLFDAAMQLRLMPAGNPNRYAISPVGPNYAGPWAVTP